LRPVETVPGMGVGGIKNNYEGGIQLWYIVRTLVNVIMYSQYNKNLEKDFLKNWCKTEFVAQVVKCWSRKNWCMLVMAKDLSAILRTNDISNFHNGASAVG
jgi:hypothetical protein